MQLHQSTRWLGIIRISLLAALVYGSWAAFANSEYGFAVALKAGMGQGGYALFSTFWVTVSALRVFCLCRGGWFGVCIGFMVSFFVMASIPLTIHAILRTPNAWQAMLPGLIWGSGYILVLLFRQRVLFHDKLAGNRCSK